MKKELSVGFSSCPNDTFIFDAWVHNKIDSKITAQPAIADVQELNQQAFFGRYPVTKLSTFCLGKVTDLYGLLPVGGAIGDNSGPKIVAYDAIDPKDFHMKTLAIPGFDTTAFLTFRVLFPEVKSIISCRYDEVAPMVLARKADLGLIIHETRFTYQKSGLVECADLGMEFYKRFQTPLPLGVIAASRSLDEATIQEVIRSITQSIAYAKKHPESSQKFINDLSIEKNSSIIKQHIDLYVNQETEQLSQAGFEAIDMLFERARSLQLLDTSSKNFYFDFLRR